MNMPFLKLGFLMLVLACLAACSSSNNLKNPTNGSATVEASCDPSKAGCVEGQFVADEVVSGLSYTCTSTDQSVTVTSVTDANGFFTCPSGATATFYIGTVASSNQVILGSTTITPQALPALTTSTGATAQTSGVISVSPITLVLGSAITSAGDPTANIKVQNMVRFLKALDSDGSTWNSVDFSGFNGSNRILISDQVSEQVAKLTSSLQASEFAGSDLSPALQGFIDSIPGKDHTVDVPPAAVAQLQLKDFLNGSVAGVYISSGLPCATTDLTTLLGQVIFDEGMCNNGASGTDPRSGDLMLFVDRTGYGFGFGVTSLSNNISTPPVTGFYVEGLDANKKPSATSPLTRPFAFDTGQLTLAAESQVSGSSTQAMGWTGTLKGGAIASTTELYDRIYNTGLDTGASNNLGVWKYGSGQLQGNATSGQFFMYNSKPANLYLDSSVYDQLRFPINLQLTFEYAPSSGAACTYPSTTDSSYCLMDTTPPKIAGASTSYGSVGTLQISILKNGNIVTNLNQDCNQLQDPTAPTLVDSNGQTEYRIGFVSTVTSGVMPSDSKKNTVNQLSLTLMFPKNVNVNLPTQLQGVLAGISGSSLFKLPVSGNSAYTVVLADSASSGGVTPYQWYNYFDLISVINASTGTVGALPHDFSSGSILVRKVTNKVDPSSSSSPSCSS